MIQRVLQFWHAITPGERVCLGAALVLFALVGYGLAHPRVVTVTKIEYKDRVVVQEKQVIVEKPVVEYRDRVITRYVTRPDGTRIETHVEEQSGKQTGEKVTTTETAKTEEVSAKQTVTQLDAPRLHLIAEFDPTLNLGPGPKLSASATVMGLYDFARIGPVSLFTGLEVITPVLPSVQPPIFIVPLGISISR